MNLSDLTVKQRKILKLVTLGEIDIGHMMDEGISLEDSVDLVAKAKKKILQKKVTATQDDLNA
jgi:hypothetical protein